jgi:hypothetical protein
MAATTKNKQPAVVPDGVRRRPSLRVRSASRLVMQIIEQAKENPMTAEELAAENSRLMAYGAQHAKRAGTKERDVPRIIHESRSRLTDALKPTSLLRHPALP